ncbi:nucleotide exchange factor GrpE [Citricoccus sp. GCM10030269]|uniref:nucleotide exchange factor GrpE n=1 Tax=Citricoccus sp. GCM10030269 TaxID=3273388 RepID=UPI003618D9DE
MANHGNDEEREHEEPVSFQDKRRVDPETGKVRGPGAAADSGSGDADGDALSQAQRILNDAAGEVGDEGASPEETVVAGNAGGTPPVDSDTDAQNADAQNTAAQNNAGASAREEELRNDLLRVQAEFVNYKRRVDRDRDVAKDNAIQSVLTALLPVLDDLDAARAAGDLPEGPVSSIATKFETVLTGFGLERQDQDTLAGQAFDPTHHEAMLRQPNSEIPEGHIVQVFRSGYIRGERVLRAAQVMVSAGDEGGDSSGAEPAGGEAEA